MTDEIPVDQTDAEVAALLPARSPGRVALWVAVFVVAILVAGGMPAILNPGIAQLHSASGALVPGTPFMVSDYPDVATDGWFSADLVEVDAVPGTRVAGAWLASADQADRALAALPGPDAPRRPMDAAALGGLLGTSSMRALPARMDGSHLIIVWQILDCDALSDGNAPITVAVRSLLGTVSETSAWDQMAGLVPTQNDLDTLREYGMCPA